MSELVLQEFPMAPATPEIIEKIRRIEERIRPHEHLLRVRMEHHLHAGLYARTCHLEANSVITSVLIKIPTLLIVSGTCLILAGEEWRELNGYHVLCAPAMRKQIYVTLGPTQITMAFATQARTVEEAECEFTDEWVQLLSRREYNEEAKPVGVK